MTNFQKKNSFTLIEILIVIVIIGLLAFTLIPRILAAQQRARDTRRIADVRQIGIGLQSYIYTNNTIPNSAGTGYKDISSISGALLEYLKSIPDDKGRGLMVNSDGHCISSGNNYAYYIDGNKAAVTASMEGGKGNTAFCKGQVSTKMMFPKHSDGYNLDMGDYINYGRTLVKWSDDFLNSSWGKTKSPTMLSNIAIAPDGTLTADSIQDTVGGGVSAHKIIGQERIVAPYSTITASIFVKKETSKTAFGGLGIYYFHQTNPKSLYLIFDEVTGSYHVRSAVSSTSLSGFANIENYNENWWRISLTVTDVMGYTNPQVMYYGTLSSNGTDGIAVAGSPRTIRGAQLEEGSTASPYEKTENTTYVGEMY